MRLDDWPDDASTRAHRKQRVAEIMGRVELGVDPPVAAEVRPAESLEAYLARHDAAFVDTSPEAVAHRLRLPVPGEPRDIPDDQD